MTDTDETPPPTPTDKMPTNQVVLFWVRLIVGGAGVVFGWLSYPTGDVVAPERAVPIAMVAVGALFALQAGLDLMWMRATGAEPAPLDNPQGPQSVIAAFVASISTVLGLLAAFGEHPSQAIRLGALILVIAVIVGLMLLLYVAYGIGGPATASLLAWMVSVLFATTSFGLACIGLAVYFRR